MFYICFHSRIVLKVYMVLRERELTNPKKSLTKHSDLSLSSVARSHATTVIIFELIFCSSQLPLESIYYIYSMFIFVISLLFIYYCYNIRYKSLFNIQGHKIWCHSHFLCDLLFSFLHIIYFPGKVDLFSFFKHFSLFFFLLNL